MFAQIKKPFALAAFVLLGAAAALAQQGTAQLPTYHDGQTITYSVTFDGPDAGKIKTVMLTFTTDEPKANQAGFNTQLYPGECRPNGPNTFLLSFKVADNQASGEYRLMNIRGITDPAGSPINANYSTTDFGSIKLRIENNHHFTRPTVKVQVVSTP